MYPVGLQVVCIQMFLTYPLLAKNDRNPYQVTIGSWGTVVDSGSMGLYIYLISEAVIRVPHGDFQRLFTVRLRETQEQITQLQLVQAQSQLQALNTENDNGQA